MRIGEVAKQAGIPASTLRYYERIGLINPPQRKGGQRDYDEGILEILDIIRLAKSADFSLTDIRQLIKTHKTDIPLSLVWRQIAQDKILEVEQTIQHYQDIHQKLTAGMSCECKGLTDCQWVA